MKNVLLLIIILGMLAGIGSAYLGLTSHTKALKIKEGAEKQTTESLNARQKAEEEQKKAEARQSEAELKAENALTEKDTFDKIAKVANEAKDMALQEAAEAKKLCDKMEIKMNEAIALAEKAHQEKDEAFGKSDADEIIKQHAEKTLEKTLADLKNAQEEVAKIRELSANAQRIAQFINAFTSILFNSIEAGDNNFKEGLDTFSNAQTLREKSKAINLITEGGKKYKKAQEEVTKIEAIVNNNISLDIIKKTLESINENINCINATSEFLNSALQSNTLPNEGKGREIYLNVRQRKEKADKLLTETCENLLNLFNSNKEGFTITHLEMIRKAKDKFYQRWLPPENYKESKNGQHPD